jgi:hypothetical protein
VNAGVEECDDSNSVTEQCVYGEASCEVCDASCELVAGETDVCGDGTVDVGETCDDSNATTEACAYGLTSCSVCNSSCQTAAVADLGAAVDHAVAAVRGRAGGASCDASCQPLVDNCTPCRQANCTSYQGINWVAGCFDSSATGDAARAVAGVTLSPTDVQACVDAMACASANDCGRTLGAIANDCYCGAFGGGFGLDECIAVGPNNGTGDAPCSDEWRALTAETVPANVLGAIQDITLASGWAYFLLECEATFCSSVCP